MLFLTNLWNKIKSYGLVIASVAAGLFYLLFKYEKWAKERAQEQRDTLDKANKENVAQIQNIKANIAETAKTDAAIEKIDSCTGIKVDSNGNIV